MNQANTMKWKIRIEVETEDHESPEPKRTAVEVSGSWEAGECALSAMDCLATDMGFACLGLESLGGVLVSDDENLVDSFEIGLTP